MTNFGNSRGKKRRSRKRFDEIPKSLPSVSQSTCTENLQGQESNIPNIQLENPFEVQYTQANVLNFMNHFQDFDRLNSSNLPSSTDADRQDADEQFLFQDEVASDSEQGFDSIGIGSHFDSVGVSDENESPTNTNGERSSDNATPLPHTKLDNWRVIWALVMTNGSRRLTKEAYQSVRSLADSFQRVQRFSWKSESTNETSRGTNIEVRSLSFLPHYSTLQKSYKQSVLQTLATRSIEFCEPVDKSKAGVNATSFERDGETLAAVRCVLPSEYARFDMATPSLWSAMRSTSLCSQPADLCQSYNGSTPYCVDKVPVIAAREWFYGRRRAMHIDKSSHDGPHTAFAEIGDTVTVQVLQISELSEQVIRCFRNESSASACNSTCDSLRGIVAHSWNVHHSKRYGDDALRESISYYVSPRDQRIAEVMGFREYSSPSDLVKISIPELPEDEDANSTNTCTDRPVFSGIRRKRHTTSEQSEAIKKRRAAIRQRNLQVEQAWSSWEKPLLKPGDFVVMLRPDFTVSRGNSSTLLTQVDKDSRLLIVHRFWTEQEEKSRHVLWVPGGSSMNEFSLDFGAHFRCISCPISSNPQKIYVNVHSTQLVSVHQGKRGYEKFEPISSVGVLNTGENYFIYRFILFWDGFQMYTGKQASGDGIYMLNLNLPLKARASPNAVRILTLTPPGSKTALVLNRIFPDIIKGMTEGFLDTDADGKPRRIFLDLVGVLGDTPALNSILDVPGHTGNFCCHLCRYVKSSAVMTGSKYANTGFYGLHPAYSRGFFQHRAVADCSPSHDTCRAIGIKQDTIAPLMSLHALRNKMFQSKSSIRTTSSGKPVVPHTFDPYRASFIAPDHLLTGHLRDCVNLAFKLLPDSIHRKSVHNVLLAFLKKGGLTAQNRIFDLDRKSLYNMSMSELYSMGLIAELAFLQGCTCVAESEENASTPSQKCMDAISLLGSCANIITLIWRLPESDRDGCVAVQVFNEQKGQGYISSVQLKVENHIGKVRSLCQMADSDQMALQDPETPALQRFALLKLNRECLLAIKTIDKPNLHRLYELAFCTLPMVGHMSVLGELILEKTHQFLKRALKQTNFKNIQKLCMESTSFDDWQGRLTSVISEALRGEKRHLLACFRLLYGREAVSRLNGKLSRSVENKVIQIMGPDTCLKEELLRQGRCVSSPWCDKISSVSWSLSGKKQVFQINGSVTHNELAVQFLRALRKQGTSCTVQIAEGVISRTPTGYYGHSFRRGNVVETLCCYASNASFHYPRLLQCNISTFLGSRTAECGLCLWLIEDVFSFSEKLSGPDFYVSVRPCIEERNQNFSRTMQHKIKKYTVPIDSKLSFAAIDASMRKVAVIPDSNHQIANSDNYSSTILSASHFYALSRDTGFPPRQG